jgi:hypothetical protein
MNNDDGSKLEGKVMLAHDYLIQMGGAERVVAAMATQFPAALIYTSVTRYSTLLPSIDPSRIRNTWMQRIPHIAENFKRWFPFYPLAFRSLRPSPAVVAWVSSSGFAKWMRWREGTVTICYVHTPPRFFWSQTSISSMRCREEC